METALVAGPAATGSPLAVDPTLDVVDGSRIAQVTVRLGETVVESRPLDGRDRPIPRAARVLRWGWALPAAAPLGLLLGWPGLTAVLSLLGVATGLSGTLRLRSHRRPSQLLVGSGPGVDLPLDDPALHRHPLVTTGPEGPTLHVTPGMEGTVVIGRTVRSLSDLEAHPSPLTPGASSFAIPEGARVEVRLGPTRVEVSSVAPTRSLPPARSRLLWREQLCHAGSFVVHAAVVVAALIVAPARPARPIEEVQRRLVRVRARWTPSFRGDPVPFHPSFARARDPHIGNTRAPRARPGLHSLRGPRDNADPHPPQLARDAAARAGTLSLLGNLSGEGAIDFPDPETPRVAVGRLEIRGSYPGKTIRRVILRHLGEVKHCYQSTLPFNPGLHGRVVVRFVISRGRASGPAVVKSTLGVAGVEACLVEVTRRWRFPYGWVPGATMVEVPLVFRR